MPICAFSKFFKWIFLLLTRNKYNIVGITLIYLNLYVYDHHLIIKGCRKCKYMQNIRITVMPKHSYMQINFQQHTIKTKNILIFVKLLSFHVGVVFFELLILVKINICGSFDVFVSVCVCVCVWEKKTFSLKVKK